MNPGFASFGLALLAGISAIGGLFAQEVSASESSHQQYRVVILPVDGGADSIEPGYLFYAPLNNRGTVAVSGDTATPGALNGYTWTAGRQTDLQPLPPLGNFSASNYLYVNWINLWGVSRDLPPEPIQLRVPPSITRSFGHRTAGSLTWWARATRKVTQSG